MVDGKLLQRIVVWPTYEDAIIAEQEAASTDCKRSNKLTVWDTYEQAAAHVSAGSGGGGAYHADAVTLSANFMMKNSASVGAVASAGYLLAAGWFGNATADGSAFFFQQDIFDGFSIEWDDNGDGTAYFEITAVRGSDAETIFDSGQSVVPVNLRSGWHSWAVWVDLDEHVVQLVADRNFITLEWDDWFNEGPMSISEGGLAPNAWSLQNWGTGTIATSNFMATISNSSFDLSIAANLNKLFTTDNKPVDWGADGSNIQGFAALFCFQGTAFSWFNNGGAEGGDFSVTAGSLTDAPSPSD